jgi:hypothetical protein
MNKRSYPIIFAGSWYGDENDQDGHPAILIIHPPFDNGTPVEAVAEVLPVPFSDAPQVDDLLSKWEEYADLHGYAFEADPELYQDDGGVWRLIEAQD